MSTIVEFIKQHNLKLNYTVVPENPSMEDSQKTMNNYACWIVNGKSSILLYYSKGIGLRVWKRGFGVRLGKGEIPGQPAPYRSKPTIHYMENTEPEPPKLDEVLDCMVSDVAGVIDGQSFEEWANEYGYDTDSRKAEKTYNACREEQRQLISLFGRAGLNELLKIERL